MSLADTVYTALARQLGRPVDEIRAAAGHDLGDLGLDSHGLVRVLLDIERALGCDQALDLDDRYLDSPATMVAGIAAQLDVSE